MKNFYSLLSGAVIVTGALIFSGFSGGSPGGYSGSPANNDNNCTQCHTGVATDVSGWITSDIPEAGYTPGETYTITTTLTDASAIKAGFDLSVEDISGTHQGTLANINTDETQIKQSGSSITHKSTSNTPTGGEKSWSFNWTAPEEAAGEITFYAAFNAANGNGNTAGDQIYKSMMTVDLDDVGINENSNLFAVYPNPAKDNFIIQSNNHTSGKYQIYDLQGRLVLEGQLGTGSNQIQIGNLEKGVYFVSIPEYRYTKKIIKT